MFFSYESLTNPPDCVMVNTITYKEDYMRTILATSIVNGKIYRFQKTLKEQKCKECGNFFNPKRTTSKYCSKICGKKVYQKKYADANKDKINKYYQKHRTELLKKRREKYALDPTIREANKKWCDEHKEIRKHQKRKSVDKIYHGGKKEHVIKKNGLVCSKCGDVKKKHCEIVMHHTNFDPTDHDFQELLCISCHNKIHKKGKPSHNLIYFSKQQILEAINSARTFFEASKKLGISQGALRRKRKLFNLPIRKRNAK